MIQMWARPRGVAPDALFALMCGDLSAPVTFAVERTGWAPTVALTAFLRGLIAAWAAAHGRRPRLAFVEDRLETLQHVTTHADLDDVALYLADWGYNTEAARARARADARIGLLTLEQFRAGTAAWP